MKELIKMILEKRNIQRTPVKQINRDLEQLENVNPTAVANEPKHAKTDKRNRQDPPKSRKVLFPPEQGSGEKNTDSDKSQTLP